MKKILLIILLLGFKLCFTQTAVEQIDLSECALELTKKNVTYDPSYFSIDYPNGDVPSDKGVCTDVVIRAYRKIGIVVEKKARDGKRNLIVHNIGGGQVLEDCLFDFKIIGHYRYGI